MNLEYLISVYRSGLSGDEYGVHVYMYWMCLICRLISPCAVVWSSQLQWPCSSSALLAWSSTWLLALTEYVFLSQATVVWSVCKSHFFHWWLACLSVYISVCLHISKPDIQTSHKISHMCYHGPWIGPPLMKMEYVICGWRHVFP